MGILDKPYLAITDVASRDVQRMTDLGVVARARSAQMAGSVYTNTRAAAGSGGNIGQFSEPWANTTNWVVQTSPIYVNTTTGVLFCFSSDTVNCYAYRGISLGTGTYNNTVRIVTSVVVQALTTTAAAQSVFIGISSTGTGTTGNAGIRGLTFGITSAGTGVQKCDNGTVTSSNNTAAIVAGIYNVTIFIDANFYTITALSPDGTQEYRAQWTRASIPTPYMGIYINDNRTNTTGYGVGPMSWVYGISTGTPRSVAVTPYRLIEGANRTFLWTSVPTSFGGGGTGMIRATLPPTYDGSVASPFVLMWHGYGGNELSPSDDVQTKVVANALVAAGFIVVGFSSAPGTATSLSPWGGLEITSTSGQGSFTAMTWAALMHCWHWLSDVFPVLWEQSSLHRPLTCCWPTTTLHKHSLPVLTLLIRWPPEHYQRPLLLGQTRCRPQFLSLREQ